MTTPLKTASTEASQDGETTASEVAGLGSTLSPREREVLALLTTATQQEAADRLGISRSGVRWHLNQAYSKLYTRGLPQTWTALGWLVPR